ncbi:type II toxin-antitoxin system ParD family antitoxin [Scytonema hofmannii FACHB-248]|jgi:antitoxin ParD1/3/4|uniref:Type II toxin-antitoxin system ParD family antitoxin n=1 Tax=Scytonema hofmannii FACHB-248 TaxID=1842502 RepID=A0ABR8GV77_9CYAN|nr:MULTISPECIES: type II toxin-antitoxin system ParD family antitoxin [Nostocales]MBD2606658.1 type II toxin-antitoxin system ParD family antitoxin [Scytonema hofmannii FACHB-248]
MNISLTPELEKLVHDKVATGLYTSASEVIRESLRLLQEHDKVKEFRLLELKKEIQKGIDQIERGEFTVYDTESIKTLGEEIKQRGQKKKENSQAK